MSFYALDNHNELTQNDLFIVNEQCRCNEPDYSMSFLSASGEIDEHFVEDRLIDLTIEWLTGLLTFPLNFIIQPQIHDKPKNKANPREISQNKN